MKSPVVFRASFKGPIGPLNPSGWKVPGPIWVEIFHQKVGGGKNPAQWAARRPGTDSLFEITPQNTADTLKTQIAGLYFEERITMWVAYDLSSGKPEELADDEWATNSQGKVFITPIRAARVAEKGIRERAERSRQQTETYERDFKPQ